MPEYYDGNKLLNLKDLNRKTPEIFVVDGNRTGGKSTFFGKFLVNNFLKKNHKFMLLYRYINELDNISESFFKGIKEHFYPEAEMTHKAFSNGKYLELYLNKIPCGYAVSLNAANFIKKNSHLFADTMSMFFDEFQPEDNLYLTDEINKLISVHTSVARGFGEQVRYVPLYMASNSVTLLNPYYTSFGFASRIKEDTKFLRGYGVVMEHNYNKSAATAQKSSAFNQAFGETSYLDYATENVYLNDSKAFIENIKEKMKYKYTIRYKGDIFSIKECQPLGIIYCDTSYDLSFPYRLSITTKDHDVNYVMLANNQDIIWSLRNYYIHGCFRFRNLKCKEAIMAMLSY